MRKTPFLVSVLLVLLVLLSFPVHINATAGQWSASGSNIYYTDGNVGLGNSAPESKLDLIGGTDSSLNSRVLRLGTIDDRTWDFTAGKYGDVNKGHYSLTISQPSYPDCITCKGDLHLKPGRNIIITQGNMGIGLGWNPTEKLEVNGKIKAKEIIVTNTGWADYVFDEDYNLLSLAEVEAYIKANGHLPNIPSAEEVAAKGLSVSEMQGKQMEKIEELTLHLIEKDKQISELEQTKDQEIAELSARLAKLEAALN